MPVWLILTIFSILTVSLAEVIQKITLTNKINISSITNNFYLWLSISFLALITSLIFGFRLPQNFTFSLPIFGKFLAVAFCYFFGGSLFYQSFKGNSAALSVILGSVSSIITAVAGIIFFQESAAILKIFGSIIILFAIIIVNYSKNQRVDKYNLYAFTGGVFYGIAYSLDKSFIYTFNPIIYQAIICFLVAFLSFVLKSKLIIKETKLINLTAVKSMALAAFSFYLYQVCLFNAYKYSGEVGKIIFISNTSIFIVFLLEFVLLKNKSDLTKKIIASVIAFLGSGLIALAR